MKKLFLSSLILCSLSFSYAQDMTPEQVEALQEISKELHPTNETQRNSWLRMQKNAFDSIKYSNFALSPAELDSIKRDAAAKYPNDYVEQEEHVRSQANTMINLNHMSRGIDPKEFGVIKNLAAQESNGDPAAYMTIIQEHLEAKTRIKNMPIPDGIDEIDFKILIRVVEKNYQYNYKKQLSEIQNKVDMLASISGADNAADKNDPNAYNTISLDLIKKHTMKVGDMSNTKLAVAVNFKGKNGFFCPLSAYNENFEILSPTGEKIDIVKIHVSKTTPVMFLEVQRLPIGVEAIEIAKLDDVKAKLAKPLSLAGYFSATKPSAYRITINSIRGTNYIMNNKTPFSFIDGTMLVDYEDSKLLSFALRDDTATRELPDFNDKSKAMLLIRKANMPSKSNTDAYYPIIETIENFELLDPQKMDMQVSYLEELKADNEEALKLFTASSLSALTSSKKYGKVARDAANSFRGKLGEDKFIAQATVLMQSLISEMKKGLRTDVDPRFFYVNIRNDIVYQTKVRNLLIEFYQNALNNDLDLILPRDIVNARAEPAQQNTSSGKGKKGKGSSSRNSSLDSKSFNTPSLF